MKNTDLWQKIVSEIFSISASFGSVLKTAKLIEFTDDGSIKIEVNYKFHKDRIEEMKNKTILENIAQKNFQNKVKLECQVATAPVVDPNLVKQEKNIIGVAEEMFG